LLNEAYPSLPDYNLRGQALPSARSEGKDYDEKLMEEFSGNNKYPVRRQSLPPPLLQKGE
jgi:hypothetical protein